jgi:type II secretory pathway pseudopilin PulG
MKENMHKTYGQMVNVEGFSLIEVCIVTIISGLLFVSLFEVYSQYARHQAFDTTRDHMQQASLELNSFFAVQVRYPCPSDRTLKSTDPKYGTEVDANGITNDACNLGPTGLGLIPATVPPTWTGACYTTGVGVVAPAGTNGVGGVCAFRCSNALCGDKSGSENNIVVIGGFPLTTIRAAAGADSYGRQIMLDGWGNQLDYVVTYKLTDSGTYRFDRGAITVHDENGNDTAGITNNAHYGFISHGPDGIGSYTTNGQMFQVCGSHNPQSYNTGDDQNCSNNATFIAGIRNDTRTALHYDDSTYFVVQTSSGLWSQVSSSTDLYNVNPGIVNVGTGNAAPTANTALVVGDPTGGSNGIVHTDPAGAAKAAQVCKKDGTNCFNINALTAKAGAEVISCPSGQVMDGIYTDSTGCATPPCSHAHCRLLSGGTTFSTPVANQYCPATPTMTWIVGIASDGKIICQ